MDKVCHRKQNLESMVAECKHLNSTYDEFLTKISVMEQKVESLPELAIGKDTLKRQKTDYKVDMIIFPGSSNHISFKLTNYKDIEE